MRERVLLGFVLMMFLAMAAVAVADPAGTDMTSGDSSRRADPDVQTANAAAGNVTQLNIDQIKTTSIWQGFYGNVSGTITLDNANNQTMYDWSLTSADGQIYASRSSVSDWSGVNCTNGTQIDGEQTTLGIQNSWSDSINKTYTSQSHPAFFVGSREMQNCWSTRTYNSSEQGTFWNVLLSSSTSNVVYTAIMNDNANGFNNNTYDFEILVPTQYSTGLATYYFYAELH